MFLLVMSRAGVRNALVQGQRKVFEVVEVVVRKLSCRAIKSVERRIQRVRAVERLLQVFYRLGGWFCVVLGRGPDRSCWALRAQDRRGARETHETRPKLNYTIIRGTT